MKMLKQKFSKKTRSFANAGFSIIELIAIIAVMAVLIAVLAPSLLQYTERSRAQKDVSAMDEIVNAVELAIADSGCYDEMLRYSCENNYITYTDSSGQYGSQIVDAEFWAPDGAGRATTITFNPTKTTDGRTVYRMDTAIINDMTYGNGSVGDIRVMQGALIANNQCYLKNASAKDDSVTAYMYNKIRQTIGDTIETDSATYGNSSFTVFIRFSAVDGVVVPEVYGSFNGTNLSYDSQSSAGSGTDTYIDYTPVTTKPGGTTNKNYTSSDLVGSGSLSGTAPDYKQNESLELLEKQYKFEFYSTVKKAVDDVNANKIGQNADVDKVAAAAGIYEDGNGNVIVMVLKNVSEDEPIVTTSKMTLDLNGKTLHINANRGIDAQAGNLTINGYNGQVKVLCNQTDLQSAVVLARGDSTVIVNGGTYIGNTGISAGYNYGLYADGTSTLTANSATIKCFNNNNGQRTAGVRIYAQVNAQINNCDITSFINLQGNNVSDGVYSASPNCRINNCTIKAARSAATGTFHINGGSYSAYYTPLWLMGYDGQSKEINVRNATISHCNMMSGFTSTVAHDSFLRIGGSNTCVDIKAYVDNCVFNHMGSDHVIHMQMSYGEKNDTLYISNTTINTSLTRYMCNYSDYNHRVYIGRGCNFGVSASHYPATTFQTDEVY